MRSGSKGDRPPGAAPFGNGKTHSFIAALRHDWIDAPFVIDGPINGALFQLSVKTQRAPTVAEGGVADP
ncbi:MAG: hypothetical protein AAGM38_14790 [Pseudomonadota bacterium]